MLRTDEISYARIDELLKTHGPLVICTVVRAQGSVPRSVGSRLVVLASGDSYGTIGGGLFESRIIQEALTALQSGKSEVKTYDFRPVGSSENAFGAVCGGRAEVFFEVAVLPDALLIVGGGHCGRALARAATLLGDFAITLLDDRADFSGRGDLPESITVIQSSPDFADLSARLTENTYLVLVSQGFVTDTQALRQAIAAPVQPAYIGMMGSRRKVRTVRETLIAEGITEEALNKVHAPIGLEIGSETPAQIAISILAQIIAVRANVLSVPVKNSI